VDCQSYVAFVIEVVGTLGLSIGPNIAWNEITLESTDEPITTGNWENETIFRRGSDLPDYPFLPSSWE
jgi:hypothetical protein